MEKVFNEPLSPIRILIVDDEPDILRFLDTCLTSRGYEVQTTDNPIRALELFSQTHYDILLTDFKMPEMDGLSLLKKVKESSPLTEVILMTVYASAETAVGSMKLGAFDYLVKPFNIEEILTVIQRAVQHISAVADVHKYRDFSKMKEDFAKNMSHELRTPLASIKTASKVLLNELCEKNSLEGETADKMLSIINRSSEKMIRMVDDLLETFRIEAGKITLNRVPIAVDRMVAECVEEFLGPCQERGIYLTSNVEHDLPTVTADPVKLRRIILNLLGNAMKFTWAGGQIIIGVKKENKNSPIVEISVKDTGIGIEPEKQKKIFEKFYQADDFKTQGRDGLGLGLALVKAMVEAHGGTISVDSIPGKGSTFYVRIPVIPSSSSNFITVPGKIKEECKKNTGEEF